jgi:glycosyltransferase involved in cell wall biosynthesis
MSGRALLAHPGTQYSHQLARQLARHDLLDQFWTGFALSADGLWARLSERWLPLPWRRRIANRIVHGVAPEQLRTMPVTELGALARIRRQESPQRVFHERNRHFQERVPTSALRRASAVIGFDTSSWILAERARRLGTPFLLDRSISHPMANAAIMREVAERYPAWRRGIETRLPEVLACEEREHELATTIVAASSFTKRTLVDNGVPAGRIVVNPYGVDLRLFHPPASPRAPGPLRFLFLGAVTARKGAPLLVDAWRRLALDDAELWMVGSITASDRALVPELPGLKVLGQFPHRELPDLLRQCDVLVFPSYCEGFALVLLEALASGLPIITTDATAGPDLIADGTEGRIVPAGDLDRLGEAMRGMARARASLPAMSAAARHCAERYSWDGYGDRWQTILREHTL